MRASFTRSWSPDRPTEIAGGGVVSEPAQQLFVDEVAAKGRDVEVEGAQEIIDLGLVVAAPEIELERNPFEHDEPLGSAPVCSTSPAWRSVPNAWSTVERASSVRATKSSTERT